MTWFFAILIVLAMGGVAALAAGYGTPMAEEYDDRVDSRIPDRRLRGEDVRRVRFSTALRGYRMTEVDELLDRLSLELDRLHRELGDDAELPEEDQQESPADLVEYRPGQSEGDDAGPESH